MKNKTYILRVLYAFLGLSLLLSISFPLFLHHHHIHSLCYEPELGHSEEFCPICWFVLQWNSFALLLITFAFVFIIKIVDQIQKNPFHFSSILLDLSRAPPLIV